MKVLREITSNADYPMHVYLTNDKKDRLFGYRCGLDNSVKIFNTPKNFSRKNRRFQTINDQELVNAYTVNKQ